MNNFLEKGSDIDAAGEQCLTSLMTPAALNHMDIAKLLFEKGADINPITDIEDTALIAAVVRYAEEAVKLLLEKGADLHANPKDDRDSPSLAKT